ncbi:HPP family protein [Haloechinothrix salitolerans]|uniref:HPP family protein n=1 Tax=Haloechinothrix salitolerans TaxID=926830 RepID=A0ABW2C4X9_9PSEU
MRHQRRRPALGWRDRPGVVGALLILPALLGVLELLSVHTQLKFLLIPPLASIGYRIFRAPHAAATRARSVILAPTLGSLCGLLLSTWSGLTTLSTALAVAAGILIVEAVAADAPPTLAITLLALFGTDPDWTYPLSVLVATTSLYVVFLGWRWLAFPSASGTAAGISGRWRSISSQRRRRAARAGR